MRRFGWLIVTAGILIFGNSPVVLAESPPESCACDFSHLAGAVWWGSRHEMTVEELASYVAPVIWFSPDEPSLYHATGLDIAAPEPFPFQDIEGPVLYYQLNQVVKDANVDHPGFRETGPDRGDAVIDFRSAALLELEFFAYFAEEWGLGAHVHDVESVAFRIAIASTKREYLRDKVELKCDREHFVIFVAKVTGKAHGIEWYWNIVEVDEQTRLPMTILIEEGKHAIATDKNSDGYFTPTFDVTTRVNDAWGVRDIIRSGGLFSGGYQAWMSKTRHPAERVLPPLPEDSMLWDELEYRKSEYPRGNAVYKLAPLPPTELAAAYDAEKGPRSNLAHYLRGKYDPEAPELEEMTTLDEAFRWIDKGALKRSLSIAFYTDGKMGFSWVFPFFVLKNFEVPMTGGYILHRMYLKNHDLSDFGWTALYTPSASRWFDTYLATGVEWHDVGTGGQKEIKPEFVLETGVKFRAQIGSSPIRFLRFLTDFWGLRIGVKNYNGFEINRLRYVVEFGAGSF